MSAEVPKMTTPEQEANHEITGNNLRNAIDNLFDIKYRNHVGYRRLTTSTEGRPPVKEILWFAEGPFNKKIHVDIRDVPKIELSRTLTFHENGTYQQAYYLQDGTTHRLDFDENGKVSEHHSGLVPNIESGINDDYDFKEEEKELTLEEITRYYNRLTSPELQLLNAVESTIK